jgi:hypothetical protein
MYVFGLLFMAVFAKSLFQHLQAFTPLTFANLSEKD